MGTPTKHCGISRCFNEAPIRESGKSPPLTPSPSTTDSFNEAPIRESGKCFSRHSSDTSPVASMRPRFANRGSTTTRAAGQSSASCFNEAPIRESGKWHDGQLPHRDLGRFNEAPIRESGKCRPASTRSRFTCGFNEAPIRESGKSGQHDDGVATVAASMRPRFANRGSPSSRWGIPQRRACFNEAPIRESGKFIRLQQHLRAELASMRPRFANRGSPALYCNQYPVRFSLQ